MKALEPFICNKINTKPRVFLLLVWCFISIALSACGKATKPTQTTPDYQVINNSQSGFKIFSNTGEELSSELFVAALKDADYVLAGERHNSKKQHKAQAFILEALLKSNDKTKGVGLEMLAFNQQDILDKMHKRNLKKTLNAQNFAEQTQWQSNWGYSISDYQEPIELGLSSKLPFFALNTPKALLDFVRDNEIESANKLSPKEKRALGMPANLVLKDIIPASSEQSEYLQQIFAMHKKPQNASNKQEANARADTPEETKAKLEKEAISKVRFARFLKVQAFWDTIMAQQAVAAKAKLGGALFIMAGAGHVEYSWGIAKRIKEFEPQAKIISILPIQELIKHNNGAEFPNIPTDIHTLKAADFYILCKVDEQKPQQKRPEKRLGLQIKVVPSQNQNQVDVIVEGVVAGSRAEKAGLMNGDIIKKAGDTEIKSAQDLHLVGKKAVEESASLKLQIIRAGKSLSVEI